MIDVPVRAIDDDDDVKIADEDIIALLESELETRGLAVLGVSVLSEVVESGIIEGKVSKFEMLEIEDCDALKLLVLVLTKGGV